VTAGVLVCVACAFSTQLASFPVNFSCDALKRFQCDNHRCVPRYQLCDGVDNCGDGSDENNMTLCASRVKPCNLYAEYECANKKCIDRAQVCDFADDCGDSSDELGCREYLSLYRQLRDKRLQLSD
jgi:low density lipoprotein-related protein 2